MQHWRPCLHLDHANKKLQQVGLAVRNPERFGKLQRPYGRQCQLPHVIRHSGTPRCKNEAVPESSFLCMRVKTRDYQPKCIIIISLQDQLLSVVTRWRGSILTNFLWYLQVTILGGSITLSTLLRRLLSISTP